MFFNKNYRRIYTRLQLKLKELADLKIAERRQRIELDTSKLKKQIENGEKFAELHEFEESIKNASKLFKNLKTNSQIIEIMKKNQNYQHNFELRESWVIPKGLLIIGLISANSHVSDVYESNIKYFDKNNRVLKEELKKLPPEFSDLKNQIIGVCIKMETKRQSTVSLWGSSGGPYPVTKAMSSFVPGCGNFRAWAEAKDLNNSSLSLVHRLKEFNRKLESVKNLDQNLTRESIERFTEFFYLKATTLILEKEYERSIMADLIPIPKKITKKELLDIEIQLREEFENHHKEVDYVLSHVTKNRVSVSNEVEFYVPQQESVSETGMTACSIRETHFHSFWFFF